ncbi:RFS2 [Scenedesmus sp. PABB004]|nr:RFS2 [Scenedesmus sp. PABB004]
MQLARAAAAPCRSASSLTALISTRSASLGLRARRAPLGAAAPRRLPAPPPGRLPRVLASATTRRVAGVEQGPPSDSGAGSQAALLQRAQAGGWPQPPQQQQQQQRGSSGMTGSAAAPPGGGVPSLDHPSIVPLQLDGDAVRDACGRVLLERASARLSLNPRESRHGALVFGASSEQGPAASWDVVLGQLKFTRFLACARNKLWWMTPEWGSSGGALPPETQFLLLELEAGAGGEQAYGLVLPLIDGDFRATLRPNRWAGRGLRAARGGLRRWFVCVCCRCCVLCRRAAAGGACRARRPAARSRPP